jgi:hypothetical protein
MKKLPSIGFVVLLILSTVSIFAQSGGFPSELRAYLGLTTTQVANMAQKVITFYDFIDAEFDRQDVLQDEVGDELGKQSPDPAVVGAKVVEIEMIDRAVEKKYLETVAQMRAELTAEQLTKMKSLEAAYSVVHLIEQAQDVGLWSPDNEQGPFYLMSEKPSAFKKVLKGLKAKHAKAKAAKSAP